jgi:6,7-dimethyl-8-ribityllumazine synthase
MKIAIIYSSFYHNYETELLKNALSFFTKHSPEAETTIQENLQKLETENFIINALPNNFNSIYSQVSIAKVSGAMEIPQVTKWLLERNQYAGILVLGCVIKGETSHFEHVSQVAMNGIAKLALKFSTPIANGIITTYTEKDAIERISSNGKNLGLKTIEALDAMIHLKNKISYDHL